MTIVIVGWVDRAIEPFVASPINILIYAVGTQQCCVLPKIQICRRETALLCPEYKLFWI
ncbi:MULTISPECIES: hypothetical protein [unclassified Microcoleus]|uniref:hypothetical protein n=1 Tax=unclassified Microcoleus TaxID=2642155 RepID=UPI002FD21D79